MITTVTTTTVTTVTTMGVTSFTLVAICTMLILLLNKELILANQRSWAVRLRSAINVTMIPLLIIFITTVFMKVYDVIWR